MTNAKFTPATPFPSITWPTVQEGQIDIAGLDGWRMLVVYRGKHCPLCKRYLKTLNGMLGDFAEAGVKIAAVSADPREKAAADVESEGWTFPVGFGLTPEEMRKLGLYVSEPRSPQETDRPFSEPGIFVVNPAGNVQIVDVSNAPFSRPDLQTLLNGIKFVMEKDYPVRGTLS
ncbi:MAG: redoxin domain-containing protein [Rhodomicrobium sp.]|nr:redoxin domain-containing protein [Rhodomicrobium sp.]